MNSKAVLGVAAAACLLSSAVAHIADSKFFLGESCSDESMGSVRLEYLTSYRTGVFGESAAEAVDFDKATTSVLVVNSNQGQVQAIDVSGLDGGAPLAPETLPVPEGFIPTAVSANGGLVAVTLANVSSFVDGTAEVTVQLPGGVGFYTKASGSWVEVGLVDFSEESLQRSLLGDSGMPLGYAGNTPDSLKFTPDGKYVVVAVEGEGTFVVDKIADFEGYAADRKNGEGSVIIIEVSTVGPSYTFVAHNADFRSLGLSNDLTCPLCSGTGANFQHELYEDGVRYGAHIDAEPEFVAVSDDSTTAYVTLQENNALAVVDLATKTVTHVVGLGVKNAAEVPLDLSDNGAIEINNYPGVVTMYMPDSIVYKSIGNSAYLFTANEGDSRDNEETKVADVVLSAALQANMGPELLARFADEEDLGGFAMHANLGLSATGDSYDRIVGFGGRSMSIWDTTGTLVWDSGAMVEAKIAELVQDGLLPEEAFNASNDEAKFDARSSSKGPEPEAIDSADFGGRTYAFLGLERNSGLLVFDVTDLEHANLVQYVARRGFTEDGEDEIPGADLGPEYVKVIKAEDSPTGGALLVVSNEVSGSIGFWKINVCEMQDADMRGHYGA